MVHRPHGGASVRLSSPPPAWCTCCICPVQARDTTQRMSHGRREKKILRMRPADWRRWMQDMISSNSSARAAAGKQYVGLRGRAEREGEEGSPRKTEGEGCRGQIPARSCDLWSLGVCLLFLRGRYEANTSALRAVAVAEVLRFRRAPVKTASSRKTCPPAK